MNIFISPSKTFTNDMTPGLTEPFFKEKTDILHNKLKGLSKETLKRNFKLSDKLLDQVYAYIHDSKKSSSAALYTYGGTLFKALDPKSLNIIHHDLYIFSAFYGLLRAHDKINPYRLDFTHRFLGSLYYFWQDDISSFIKSESKYMISIDLTSKEFAPLIPQFLNIYRIDFILKDARISNVVLKQMRGAMARAIIKENIRSVDEVKSLKVNGFTYQKDKSGPYNLIFEK